MSEKIEKYNDIAIEVAKLAPILVKDDHDAELEAVKLIRELRQIIERLRRIVDDDEQPQVEVHSLQDAMKLNRAEMEKECEENLRNGDLKEGGEMSEPT